MFESNSIEPSGELKAALARIEQLKVDGARIETAITKTRDTLRSAEATLEEVRARLADAESNAALTDGPADPRVRKQLAVVRDEVELLTARLAGLEGKLSVNRAAIADAQQAVEQAWVKFSRAEVEKFITGEFDSVMGAFLESLQVLRAIAVAVGDRGLVNITHGIVIPDVTNPQRNLANVHRMDWRQNERAKAAYGRLSDIHIAVAGRNTEQIIAAPLETV